MPTNSEDAVSRSYKNEANDANGTVEPSKEIAFARLAIGLVQGIALYVLYKCASEKIWPDDLKFLFIPLTLIAALVPIILISTLGHAQSRLVEIWGGIATIVLTLLGYYDYWRAGFSAFSDLVGNEASPFFPNFSLISGLLAGFSIAQALVLAASADGKPIAHYATYFERAWKCAVQMLFAGIFVGLLWLVLELGALLFMLIKLDFLQTLLAKRWFSITATTLAFSFAFHLTDVRPNIVKGIRTLLLVLLSWLLPLAVLIVSGFLLGLLWTGMAPLWTTRHAASVLLWAAVTLIVLINAAYQNGLPGVEVARTLRVGARMACILLLPITLMAIYAVAARVQQYGWTSSRVIAGAALLVVGFYTAGYCRAAMSRQVWLKQIANTNIYAAIFIIFILILLLSPLCDPARIAVASQLRQLESGKISAAKFDFVYLRFDGARYGIAALRKLSTSADTGTDSNIGNAAERKSIQQAAVTALQQTNRWNAKQSIDKTAGLNAMSTVGEREMLAENLHVFPAAKSLPASFLNQSWTDDAPTSNALPSCFKIKGKICAVYFTDLGGGADKDLLLFSDDANPQVFEQAGDGHWKIAATIPLYPKECRTQLQRAIETGRYQAVTPKRKEIEFDGQRVQVQPFGQVPLTCNANSFQTTTVHP
ncbi:MAG TPA: DUF4153 domain-containing protein [Herbaspirillum sp.]